MKKRRQNQPKSEKHISIISSIETVFQDNYEYEEYFEISNNLQVAENCPSDIDIEITSKVKRVRLSRPKSFEEKSLLLVLVPGGKMSAKEKESIRERYFKKYCSLIDKIRLDMRDEFAVRRKLLTNKQEKKLINAKVRRKRQVGLKEVKSKIKTK